MSQAARWCGFLATTLIVVLIGFNIVDEPSRQREAQDRHRTAAIREGTDLYALYCVECHGATGEGLAANPALNQAFVQEQESGLLFNVIERGRYNTQMAAFGLNEGGPLTSTQIDNLVTILQDADWESIQTRVAELGLTPVQDVTASATLNDAALAATTLDQNTALSLAQNLFSNNCIECHGENGEGTAQAPQLNNAYVRGMSAAQLTDIITLGVARTEMDSFAQKFSQDEIAALIFFLQNWGILSGGAPEVIDVSSVTETGQELFETWCAMCHGVSGEGSSIAPSLNDIPSVPADFIVSRVRSGYNAMPPFSETDLSNAQLAVLIDYAQGSIIGSALPVLTEDDAAHAAELYSLMCQECHGDSGQGVDEKGPAIVTVPPMRASEIANFVRFGSAQAEAFTPATLPDEDLALIVAYIHSLSQ